MTIRAFVPANIDKLDWPSDEACLACGAGLYFALDPTPGHMETLRYIFYCPSCDKTYERGVE